MRNLFRFFLLVLLALVFCLPLVAQAGPPIAIAIELLPSAARTADVTVNYVNQFQGQCSVYFVVDVTADPAAASIALRIRMLKLDGVTNWAWTAPSGVLLGSTAIDSVSTTKHILGSSVGSGILGAATVEANMLPSHWQLFMDHADGDSITYSVTAYFGQCMP